MSVYHDEVEIEDFEYDEVEEIYYYPCPCGDQFQISKADLLSGDDEAMCPSCSLIVKVIYNKESLLPKKDKVDSIKVDSAIETEQKLSSSEV
ncbi:hypothetical protein M0802_016090 [Mischocyttarus mexicanus]|nr:hypothetical protein M0802_016090 [Mischocyttarus mexicanus]